MDEQFYAERLGQALPGLRTALSDAANRSGRDAASVRVIAVTKGHPVAALHAAWAAGLRDFGENRVEALEERVREPGLEGVRWHMIGHLQSRKAGRLPAAVGWVHSVDSERLASRLSQGAEHHGALLRILIQVNTAGEQTKSGFAPDEVAGALERVLSLPGLRVEGFMTMAPFTDDEGTIRSAFSGLRELSVRMRDRIGDGIGGELSMGMSNDFAIAIEEGSTMVRLGTVLFGERIAGGGA